MGLGAAVKQKLVDVPNGEAHARESVRHRAISLAQEEWTLWYTQDNGPCRGYASYSKNGHTEHVELHSTAGRLALSRLIYKATGQAPSRRDLEETLDALEAIAIFDSPRFDVHLRVADLGSKVYLDLADDDWQVAEVTSSGWTIIPSDQAPVKFRRPNGTQPLPIPVVNGDLSELRRFIHTDREGFILAAGWLLGAMTDRGPQPILALGGGHGSAKSCATSVLQRLVDPRGAERRSPPKSERDLAVAARNSWICSFDNLSKISPDLADSLCRLSTGNSFTTRSLYSDGDEIIFAARRPVILNSIVDVINRPDLQSRAISVQLLPIENNQRIEESEFWPMFEEARPRLLGSILTILSTALDRWSATRPKCPPRLADFYKLLTAAGPSLPWAHEELESIWARMEETAVEELLQGSPLMTVLTPILESRGKWSAPAHELLQLLDANRKFTTVPEDWPQTPQGLVGALRRMELTLQRVGWQLRLGGRDSSPKRCRFLEILPIASIEIHNQSLPFDHEGSQPRLRVVS